MNTLFDVGHEFYTFDGRDMKLATMQLYIPKKESKIVFYVVIDGEFIEVEKLVNPTDWRFEWSNAPISTDAFEFLVKSVVDVPNTPVYSVNIHLASKLDLGQLSKYGRSDLDWESMCLPWKSSIRYSK